MHQALLQEWKYNPKPILTSDEIYFYQKYLIFHKKLDKWYELLKLNEKNNNKYKKMHKKYTFYRYYFPYIDFYIFTIYDHAIIFAYQFSSYEWIKLFQFIICIDKITDIECIDRNIIIPIINNRNNLINKIKQHYFLSRLYDIIVNVLLENNFDVNIYEEHIWYAIINTTNKEKYKYRNNKIIECWVCYEYEFVSDWKCRYCNINVLCWKCTKKTNKCPICREHLIIKYMNFIYPHIFIL